VNWSLGELAGLASFPISDLMEGRLTEIYAAKVNRHLDRLRSGKTSEVSIKYRTTDGQTLLVQDTAYPALSEHGIAKVLGVVRRTSPLENKHDIAGWPEEVVEGFGQGIAYWTHDKRLLRTNRNFRALFTPLVGDLTDSTLDGFLRAVAASPKLITGDNLDSWVLLNLQDIDMQTQSTWSWSDGRSYQIGWRTLPGGILMSLQDTTTIRSSERALSEARDLADEANANKSRFLAAANHDLRQPLATLKILLFTALENKALGDAADIFKAMDIAVGVMEDILESLLQIGQLDANRVAVQKQHFQASYLLERLRLQFEPHAKEKKIELRIVSSTTTIESDRILLERVLSNLIANSIKFTKHGGVLVGLRRRGRFIEIQVADTGPGIAGDQLEFIFREFYQVDADPESRKRGLGLGLNIAARLADLLQHPLRVHSTPGRGSVFSVTIPVGDIWRSKVDYVDIDERIAGEFVGMKVLVLEDDADLRSAIGLMLSRWGVSVLTVRNRKEAEEAIENFAPDLAIVDYTLPNGEHGTDAIAHIRARFNREVPSIVCTAETGRDLLSSIRATGLPVLIKPVSPARLRSVMHHLLYEREQATQLHVSDI